LTAADLHQFGLVDEIIKEPSIWVYNELRSEGDEFNESTETVYQKITDNLKRVLINHLVNLIKISDDTRLAERYRKFRLMGEWLG
jgi:acetyl-CoA carboxylase alpha subunit